MGFGDYDPKAMLEQANGAMAELRAQRALLARDNVKLVGEVQAAQEKWRTVVKERDEAIGDKKVMQSRAEAAENDLENAERGRNLFAEGLWQAWMAFDEEGPDAARKFLRDVCIVNGIMDGSGARIVLDQSGSAPSSSEEVDRRARLLHAEWQKYDPSVTFDAITEAERSRWRDVARRALEVRP